MPLFLGVHKLPSGENVEEMTHGSWEKYKEAASGMGLKPLKALVSFEKGVAYCQTEADSGDQVKEAHDKAEVPLEDVYEVQTLV
jgi:hypothetical protein